MNRKKILALVVLLLSLSFTFIMIGLRGGQFKSSLLGESASGSVVFNFSQNEVLSEFETSHEKSLLYTMLLEGSVTDGFYIPRVYMTTNDSTGNIAIAFKSKEYFAFEKQLSIVISLPNGVTYAGPTELMFEGFAASVEEKNGESITIRLTSTRVDPIIMTKQIDPFIYIPVHVNFAENKPLKIAVKEVKHITFSGLEAVPSHFQAESEILPKNNNVDQVSPNKNVYTSPKKSVYTGVVGAVQYPNIPEIEASLTTITPNEIEEGSQEPITLQIGVKDKDGIKDIEGVRVDLSTLGMSKEVRMFVDRETSDTVIFSTNFVLTSAVKNALNNFIIPYTVYDKENHKFEGNFSLKILPSNRIKVDLNNDSIVDIKDLSLFMNAYQNATTTNN